MDRAEYLSTMHVVLENDGTWAVWLIIGMSLAFAALALVNTAAMATSERRTELATIRLLGGTTGQATRMIALELAPTVLVGLLAGAGVATLSVMGVPQGVRGIPLVVPVAITLALPAGAAILALMAGAVTARLALRASPAQALRAQE
jgi:putative ABC transport system permease protein